jgi:anti-sigma regulatory factor (Ser/Thr protein kinase)
MNLLKLNPNVEELHTLNEFISNIIGKTDLQVELILEEVFVNIVSYSNSSYIHINARFENRCLTVEFIDEGIQFNPLLQEDPELPESIDEATIGGLGIYLTKQIADKISYQRINDENHLTIFKSVR